MDDDLYDFFAENPLKSELSKDRYQYLIKLFLQANPDVENCSSGDLLRWLDAKGWASNTRHLAVMAIRKYVRWKHGESHSILRVRQKRKTTKVKRCLKPAQVRTLVQSFDTSKPAGKRNLAIVCLAIDSGYRVNEIASLLAENVDFDERVCKVAVKGGEWGRGLFSEYTASTLKGWMACRKKDDPRLFQISRDGLRVTARRWGEKLGFHLTMHMFKHTGATLATRQGSPTRVLQEAYRWAKIEQAEDYTQDIEAEDFKNYFGTNILL